MVSDEDLGLSIVAYMMVEDLSIEFASSIEKVAPHASPPPDRPCMNEQVDASALRGVRPRAMLIFSKMPATQMLDTRSVKTLSPAR